MNLFVVGGLFVLCPLIHTIVTTPMSRGQARETPSPEDIRQQITDFNGFFLVMRGLRTVRGAYTKAVMVPLYPPAARTFVQLSDGLLLRYEEGWWDRNQNNNTARGSVLSVEPTTALPAIMKTISTPRVTRVQYSAGLWLYQPDNGNRYFEPAVVIPESDRSIEYVYQSATLLEQLAVAMNTSVDQFKL